MKADPEIKKILEGKKKVFITTHVRPDADAIGSSLALYLFLKSKGHECMLVFPTSFAGIYNWFPFVSDALVYKEHRAEVKCFLDTSDVIFVVDFNQLSRNGDLGKLILKRDTTKILIDHHTNPENVFDHYIWDTGFSAAAEGVFHFIELLDAVYLEDQTIATCLYAAIVADSGSFRHQGVSSSTHNIASKLLESGINHTDIHRLIYDNFTENRLRLWGFCLYEKMKVIPGVPVAYIALTKKEFESFEGKVGDTEGLVNFPLAIDGIEISVLLVEKENIVKLSFRSKEVAVNKFATQHFNGGGHVNAAGGESFKTMNDTEKLLIEKIREFF